MLGTQVAPNVWECFPDLTLAVRDKHKAVGTGGGHDFDHDLSVAQMVLFVGWTIDQYVATLAAAAALCHSADWILTEEQKLGKSGNVSRASRQDAQKMVLFFLDTYTEFSTEEKKRILYCVLNHGKRNEPSDDIVLVMLTEADRLINMARTVIPRGGQHAPMLQVFNPVTIEVDTTGRPYSEQYAEPDSLAWDYKNCTDWANPENPYCLRLPKGIELGQEYARGLLAFIQGIKDDRAKIGLYPYPVFLQ